MLKRTLWMVPALVASLAVAVFANPILLAPTGTTLTTGQVRAEAALSPNGDNGNYFWLATGVLQCEVDLIRIQNHNSTNDQNLLGVQWSFLPETSITPAISFGVTDVASQSANGIGVYAAITRQLPKNPLSRLFRNLSITAGVGAAGIRGPFFGFETKLPAGLFAEAEYDSRYVNAAAGWQPVKYFRLKAYTIQHNFYVGAEVPPLSF